MTERIKIFSHNDLDGFGAPYLLQAVQETVFPDTTFDIDNIGAAGSTSTLTAGCTARKPVASPMCTSWT